MPAELPAGHRPPLRMGREVRTDKRLPRQTMLTVPLPRQELAADARTGPRQVKRLADARTGHGPGKC